MDPIKFIRDQLGEPSINLEEYHGVKQNVTELNEAVSQIKAEVSKITSFLSTFPKPHDASNDAIEISGHPDDSNQSMENNVGDSNDSTMLNESDVVDDIADQTVINVMEEDSTEQANNLSTEESQNEITNDGFTMEIVEVDVVSQVSSELHQTIYTEKSVVSSENDETISKSVMNTTHPKMAMPNGNDTITFGDFGESQIEEACNGDVASPSSIAIVNGGVSHAENAEMVVDDVPINDTDSKSIDCRMASTPKRLSDDVNIDAMDSKMDINIADLPIILKSDDSEEQM